MWIERCVGEVQCGGLWDSRTFINSADPCGMPGPSNWENPARITPVFSIQVSLTLLNGLLSFKNSERNAAGLPHPLTKG